MAASDYAETTTGELAALEAIVTAADSLAYSICRAGAEDGLVGQMTKACEPCGRCVIKATALERLIEDYRFRGSSRPARRAEPVIF